MVQIALDGPSGAGKSTIAKMLAEKLGFIYVDTGALYRAIGFYMYQKGISKEDTDQILKSLSEIHLSLHTVNGTQQVHLNNQNVSSEIRQPEISMWASTVSAIPEVRAFLFNLQREIAKQNNVIMDGRDIGTVIMPNAQVKIFLTSSPKARAERRFKELHEKGIHTTYEEVLADMMQRDKNDSTRKTAPLRQADDAILLDNSELTLQETFLKALSIIENKIGVGVCK